jgi:hypothetical protein
LWRSTRGKEEYKCNDDENDFGLHDFSSSGINAFNKDGSSSLTKQKNV